MPAFNSTPFQMDDPQCPLAINIRGKRPCACGWTGARCEPSDKCADWIVADWNATKKFWTAE